MNMLDMFFCLLEKANEATFDLIELILPIGFITIFALVKSHKQDKRSL